MGETTKFFFLVSVATAIASFFILRTKSTRDSQLMARGFYFVCVGLSATALLFSILSPFNLLHGEVYAQLFRVLIYRAWIIAGTVLAAAFITVLSAAGVSKSRINTPVIRDFVLSPYLLNGVCLSVAVSFICTEIGKLTHDAEMRQFFLQSGYPIWFLYFVITCEILGSIGLLIPRTRVTAAACLSLLMIGAIRTHAHNGDPFSDSLEAVHLLILLACIIILRLLGQHTVGSAPAATQMARQS